ncbi:hypothetical protein WICPIJ_001475 [Wickerhamomyces pijperi]|uniref:ATPase V1 complex subunit H C-terminal domain-containing protein n=1 Tax=Wickerhamomyces pijperi TaxID=599730 RepID=A0A9P8TQK0_WICPI|nr:hypothetical protein WICPIJ_001475 [Wickerhamomyces pijperi]
MTISSTSAYLEEYQSVIRSKTLPWQSFARTSLLTSDQAEILTNLDDNLNKRRNVDNKIQDLIIRKKAGGISPEEVAAAEEEIKSLKEPVLLDQPTKTESTVGVFADLLGAEKKSPTEESMRLDVKKYLLVTLVDLFQSNEQTLQAFLKSPKVVNVVDNLASDLKNELILKDEVCKLLTIMGLVYIIIQQSVSVHVSSDLVKDLLSAHVSVLMSATSFNLNSLGLSYLSDLLTVKAYRLALLDLSSTAATSNRADLLKLLFDNLNVSTTTLNSHEQIQYQYHTLLSLVLLTYTVSSNPAQLLSFHVNYGTHYYGKLITLAKISIKEKIIRLILATFVNLTSRYETDATSKTIIKQLILIEGFAPVLKNFQLRKWSDLELLEDLEKLNDSFEEIKKDLTSFDEYSQELKTKNFRNSSPVHNNETFFVENLGKFQANNYAIFKQLASLLTDEELKEDSNALVIILNDIAKILRLDEKAITIANDFETGYKLDVMRLLSDRDSSVKFAALGVTQILVSKSLN